MFSPPLIQDLAIVGKVLFNVFWFWAPKSTGPNPDHPLKIISRPAVALSTVGAFLFRTSNFYCSGGPIVRGGPKTKVNPQLTLTYRILKDRGQVSTSFPKQQPNIFFCWGLPPSTRKDPPGPTDLPAAQESLGYVLSIWNDAGK